jgi:hypothetical protein
VVVDVAEIDDNGAAVVHQLTKVQPVLGLPEGVPGERAEGEQERPAQGGAGGLHLVSPELVEAVERLVDQRVGDPLETAAPKLGVGQELVQKRDRQRVRDQDHEAGEKQRLKQRRLAELGPDPQHRFEGVEGGAVRITGIRQDVERHEVAVAPVQVDQAVVGVWAPKVAVGDERAEDVERQIVVRLDQADAVSLLQVLEEDTLEELRLAAAGPAPDGGVIVLIAWTEAQRGEWQVRADRAERDVMRGAEPTHRLGPP